MSDTRHIKAGWSSDKNHAVKATVRGGIKRRAVPTRAMLRARRIK